MRLYIETQSGDKTIWLQNANQHPACSAPAVPAVGRTHQDKYWLRQADTFCYRPNFTKQEKDMEGEIKKKRNGPISNVRNSELGTEHRQKRNRRSWRHASMWCSFAGPKLTPDTITHWVPHRTVLHTALCYTPHSVTHRTVLHTALCYTPHCVTHCTLLHTALCYTPHCVTHCTVLHTALCYTLHSVTHRTVLHTALCYTLHCVTHCTLLHTALCYTPHCVTHCTLLHTALCYTPHCVTHRTVLHTAPWVVHLATLTLHYQSLAHTTFCNPHTTLPAVITHYILTGAAVPKPDVYDWCNFLFHADITMKRDVKYGDCCVPRISLTVPTVRTDNALYSVNAPLRVIKIHSSEMNLYLDLWEGCQLLISEWKSCISTLIDKVQV